MPTLLSTSGTRSATVQLLSMILQQQVTQNKSGLLNDALSYAAHLHQDMVVLKIVFSFAARGTYYICEEYKNAAL
jgi:hypothetical protein